MNGRTQKFDFENSSSAIEAAIESTLLWQYNNAPNLTSLVTKQAQWYAQNYSTFWKNWYDNVFNLATCNDFGITVWCIILDLPLQTAGGDPAGKPLWGFGPDSGEWEDGYAENFENGNFTVVTEPQLNKQEKRFLLQMKYFKIHSRAVPIDINRFLPNIVGGINGGTGTIYVVDNLDMTTTYHFTFPVRPVFLEKLELYDVLPRPAGVAANIIVP